MRHFSVETAEDVAVTVAAATVVAVATAVTVTVVAALLVAAHIVTSCIFSHIQITVCFINQNAR